MSYTNSSNHNLPSNPHNNSDAALFGFAGLAFLVLLLSSAASVFAASLLAGIALFVVVGAAIVLSIPLYRKHGWKSLAFVLLMLMTLWGSLGGVIVFWNHWLAFSPAAWILNGLYLASLLSGAWAAANSWIKLLAALLALALITSTAVLPRPPGGEGPLDTAEKWRIDVDVVDENQHPLEGALVLCAAVLRWESALGLSETNARQTDQDGRIPTWEFDEDPRLKVVVCSVWRNADEGNAGYPAETKFILALQSGGEYELHFTLTENPHPDVSYLTIHPSGDYEQAWYTLQFELWSQEPAGYFGSPDGVQPLQRKSWRELRGIGFNIPAEDAARELQLRYFYEGPGGVGLVPPYSETRTIYLGPIAAGTRRRLDLTIPARSSE